MKTSALVFMFLILLFSCQKEPINLLPPDPDQNPDSISQNSIPENSSLPQEKASFEKNQTTIPVHIDPPKETFHSLITDSFVVHKETSPVSAFEIKPETHFERTTPKENRPTFYKILKAGCSEIVFEEIESYRYWLRNKNYVLFISFAQNYEPERMKTMRAEIPQDKLSRILFARVSYSNLYVFQKSGQGLNLSSLIDLPERLRLSNRERKKEKEKNLREWEE